MSRLTHPADRQRHTRAQIREQERRIRAHCWQRNKTLYAHDRSSGALTVNVNDRRVRRVLTPEMVDALERHLGQEGPVLYLHPEALRRAPEPLRSEVCAAFGIAVHRGELSERTAARDLSVKEARVLHEQRRRDRRHRSLAAELVGSSELLV